MSNEREKMKEKITKNMSNNIQILRGIAIFAIVLAHNIPEGLPHAFIRPFLNFSLALFLFLSGYLSTAEKWKPKKRIAKVIVPYIIWTIIYAIMYNYKDLLSIPKKIIIYLITGKASAQMYFILIYCQLTLLIPLIDKLAKSKYKYIGFIISPLEILLMRVLPMLLGIEVNKYISTIMSISCLGLFIYYYLGYLVGNKLIVIKKHKKAYSVALVIATILQIIEGYLYYKKGIINCGTQMKLSAILTGTISMLFVEDFIKNFENKIENNEVQQSLKQEKPKIFGGGYGLKGLLLLGNNSFGIYFSHLAIMAVLNKIPMYSKYIMFPLNGIIALCITCLFITIAKKILGKYSKYFSF